MEPSIIPSTYIFSPEEARHKMLHMKPFSDSRDSRKATKITGRKKKNQGMMALENDTPKTQSLDFISYDPGLAARRASQDPNSGTFALGIC